MRVSQTLQLSFTDSANAISKTVSLPDTQASSRINMLLPSRRTERAAAEVAEEVAEAVEAEGAGAVVVVESGREVAPMVVLTFPTLLGSTPHPRINNSMALRALRSIRLAEGRRMMTNLPILSAELRL